MDSGFHRNDGEFDDTAQLKTDSESRGAFGVDCALLVTLILTPDVDCNRDVEAET